MRCAPAICALAACALMLAPAAAADGFAQGVAAGEVTSTAAVLWTRAPKAGRVVLEGSASGRMSAAGFEGLGIAEAANDLTVSIPVRGLLPGTR